MPKLSQAERLSRSLRAYRRAYRLARNWSRYASWRFAAAGIADAHYNDASIRADALAESCQNLRAYSNRVLSEAGER